MIAREIWTQAELDWADGRRRIVERTGNHLITKPIVLGKNHDPERSFNVRLGGRFVLFVLRLRMDPVYTYKVFVRDTLAPMPDGDTQLGKARDMDAALDLYEVWAVMRS